MRRTYLYLPENQWKQLNKLSRKQDTSITELIRRAVEQVYPPRRAAHFDQALDAVTGMWRERHDWDSTESYIRDLRRDNRLERLAT
jgi:hypothetical protein